MLLNGNGYNWYRLDNQMRANDLLVRSRASEHLESAAARLRDPERQAQIPAAADPRAPRPRPAILGHSLPLFPLAPLPYISMRQSTPDVAGTQTGPWLA